MKLIRGKKESMSAYLYRIYNDLGCVDLSLSMTINRGDDLYWSKRIRYDYVMSLADWEYVVGTYYRKYHRPYQKREFMDLVSHRTVLDIEFLFDIDDVTHHYIEFKDIEQKSKWVYYNLLKDGYEPVVYFTGNKSYHISVLDLRLRKMNKSSLIRFRETMLSKYNADLGLASPGHTIALEGQLHYRSGKVKELVLW